MVHLTLSHARQLNAALAPLYADPRPDRLLPRLSAAISSVFGAEMTCFDGFDEAGRIRYLGSDAPALFTTPELLASLAQRIHEHPLFQSIFVERTDNPLKITDFCSHSQFVQSTIFNEFYRLVAVTHQLIVGFDVPGQGFVTCALCRSQSDFTEAERALLAFVQPHLSALFLLAGRQGGPADPGAAAPALAATLGLTLREAVILDHLAQGQPDKAIAQHCRISPRTVQNHLRNIYAKLGVNNRTAASLRVVAAG